MNLNQYQIEAKKTDQRPTGIKDEIHLLIPLLGMVGEIGSVISEHKKRLRDGQSYSNFTEKIEEELGDVLWYLATVASDVDLTLSDIAAKNLRITQERWFEYNNFQQRRPFDSEFPATERFPKEMTIQFKENKDGKMQMFHRGRKIGDPLTDNAYVDDGYRFHDIFHFSYMAVLGWSPVLRKLLKRKRKSNSKVDEIEDGARAGIIEEAISAMIYEHAKHHNFFEGIEIIDYNILKTIKGMVKNFEIKNTPSSSWEEAILKGYEVFRDLRKNNGGKVYINLKTRTIKFLS